MCEEEIASLLNNLRVSEVEEVNNSSCNVEQIIMAPPQMNWDLFKSKLHNIKPYDGDSNTLNKFINRCDSILDSYKVYNDAELNKHIFECIQEKLIGKAEAMVGNRVEINDWATLKTALVQCFSDRRDLDCLIQELTRTRPYKGEHLIDFGSRLQLLRSSVIQRISNDVKLSKDDKICQINHYDKTALNTFIAGCSGTLKNNMHLRKPSSLEDAMAYVNEFENFERLYGTVNEPRAQNSKFQANNTSKQSNQHFAFSARPQNHQFMQNNTNFNSGAQYPRPNFVQRSYFPSQPINIQPRQMPPQKFFTNSQVFGKPQNVFAPKPIPANQLPKPEPMSTTSRNPTMISRKPMSGNQSYRFNNFSSQPSRNYQRPPNFVFEELYSNDVQEDEPITDNNDYLYQYPNSELVFDEHEHFTDDNTDLDDNPDVNFRTLASEETQD